MKLRNRIFIGIAGFLALVIVGVMSVTAYDSPCPAASTAYSGEETMRALRHRCYGVPRGVREEWVAKPVPAEGQVLIKVRAASINPSEWYRISGRPSLVRLGGGIGAPEDPLAGLDVAGVVESVGPSVLVC